MDYRLENDYRKIFDEYLKTNPSKDDFEDMCWGHYIGGMSEDDDAEVDEYQMFINQYLKNYY